MPTDLTSASLRVTDPDGTLQVSPEATTLLLDDFSTALANNWVTGGTVAPTQASGNAALAPGTTASATSYMRTVAPFRLQAATFLISAHIVQFEAAAVANSTRWWGYAQNQSTPTSAAPVLNGAVFVLDPAAGALQAAVYSGGTKTVVATLTRPTDGLQHRYEIRYRQSRVYWSVDGNITGTALYATTTFPNLAVATGLNGVAGSANASTAPSSGPVLNVSSFTMSDLGANAHPVADGVTPWVQATVKQAQAPAPAATDTQLVVQAVPPSSQVLTATAAAGTAVTVTLPAPAAGLRHYVTSIAFEQFATAALTASATPIVSTATNHQLVATFMTTGSLGGIAKDVRSFPSPLAATAQATATSFTLPATASTIWRLTVAYYVAP